MRVLRNEGGSRAPLAHPPGSLTRTRAIDLKSRSFGQAADNTGPSQESPWTFLQPLPTQGISNHTYRVIEIIGTTPDGIDAATRNGLARAAETTRGLAKAALRPATLTSGKFGARTREIRPGTRAASG